jgi:hypothetical protein
MVQPAGWSNSNWPSDVVKFFQSDAEDALAAGVPVLGAPVLGAPVVGAALGLVVGDPDGPAAGPQPVSKAAAQTHAETAGPTTPKRLTPN